MILEKPLGEQTTQQTAEQIIEKPRDYNKDPISLLEAGFDVNHKNDLMSLRWEANQFILNLWRTLSGRVLEETDGELWLIKSSRYEGIGLDDGATLHIIKTVRSYVNPVFSLAKISHEEGESFLEQTWISMANLLVLDKEFSGLPVTHKKKIVSDLVPLIWAQISRAIGGHESKHAITNITEQRAQSDIKETLSTQKQGFSLPGFGKNQPGNDNQRGYN